MAAHTRPGRKGVDQALAALIVEVVTGHINLGDDPMLAELLGARRPAPGVDPRTAAGRLGRANPDVTMTVYGHFLPEKDRAAADFLDDARRSGG